MDGHVQRIVKSDRTLENLSPWTSARVAESELASESPIPLAARERNFQKRKWLERPSEWIKAAPRASAIALPRYGILPSMKSTERFFESRAEKLQSSLDSLWTARFSRRIAAARRGANLLRAGNWRGKVERPRETLGLTRAQIENLSPAGESELALPNFET